MGLSAGEEAICEGAYTRRRTVLSQPVVRKRGEKYRQMLTLPIQGSVKLSR